MAPKKRRFGRVRKLPSGRYQARYPGPDGVDHPAPFTFATKKEAERWLTLKEAEITRDEWVDPGGGEVRFREFAGKWIAERELAPRTVALYEGLLRLHLNPTFGDMRLRDIRQSDVRTWRAARRKAKVGKVTIAKAYRLMRAVMNTAVRDRLVRENPCQIEAAGQEASEERPALSVTEVYRLADGVPDRYRALVLLAAFGGLRWGELVGLRRRYLDVEGQAVTVKEAAIELGHVEFGPTKTKASVRTIPLPALILDDLRRHLDRYAQPSPDGLVFVGERGNPLRRANFSQYWKKARKTAKLPDVRFHDLRHAGNTFAAEAGASLRELMTRMGHSSTRAALVYLHARDERARELTDAVGERAAEELRKARENRSEDGETDDTDDPDDDDPPDPAGAPA